MAIVVIKVEEEIGTLEAQILHDEGFIAGQIAPAGTYEDLETHRLVYLPQAGVLPASCDGRVAVYSQKAATWGEVVENRRAKQDKNALAAPRPALTLSDAQPATLAALKNKSRSRVKKNALAA